MPLPEPVAPLVMVIQLAALDAVHAQPVDAVTPADPVSAVSVERSRERRDAGAGRGARLRHRERLVSDGDRGASRGTRCRWRQRSSRPCRCRRRLRPMSPSASSRCSSRSTQRGVDRDLNRSSPTRRRERLAGRRDAGTRYVDPVIVTAIVAPPLSDDSVVIVTGFDGARNVTLCPGLRIMSFVVVVGARSISRLVVPLVSVPV